MLVGVVPELAGVGSRRTCPAWRACLRVAASRPVRPVP